MVPPTQLNVPQADPAAEFARLARNIESASDSLLNVADNANFLAAPPLMVNIYTDLATLRPFIEQELPQLNQNPNVWQGFPLVNQNNDGGSFLAGLFLGAIAGFWLASRAG